MHAGVEGRRKDRSRIQAIGREKEEKGEGFKWKNGWRSMQKTRKMKGKILPRVLEKATGNRLFYVYLVLCIMHIYEVYLVLYIMHIHEVTSVRLTMLPPRVIE